MEFQCGEEEISTIVYVRQNSISPEEIEGEQRNDPGGEREATLHFKEHPSTVRNTSHHRINTRKHSRVVTVEEGCEVYLFKSQFGRKLDIKSSLVPTMSDGNRLTR